MLDLPPDVPRNAGSEINVARNSDHLSMNGARRENKGILKHMRDVLPRYGLHIYLHNVSGTILSTLAFPTLVLHGTSLPSFYLLHRVVFYDEL